MWRSVPSADLGAFGGRPLTESPHDDRTTGSGKTRDTNDDGFEPAGIFERTPRWLRISLYLAFTLIIGWGLWRTVGRSGAVAVVLCAWGWRLFTRLRRERFFPEAALFENSIAREQAMKLALKQGLRGWRGWIPLVAGLAAGYGLDQAGGVIAAFFPNVVTVRTYQVTLQMIVFFAATAATWDIFRNRIRRELRTMLRERGHELCVPCGYDLTGNISGVCPECGNPA